LPAKIPHTSSPRPTGTRFSLAQISRSTDPTKLSTLKIRVPTPGGSERERPAGKMDLGNTTS